MSENAHPFIDLAWEINDVVMGDPARLQHFREQLVKWEATEASARDLREPRDLREASEQRYLRELLGDGPTLAASLPDKYAIVSAIHDNVVGGCGLDVINPWSAESAAWETIKKSGAKIPGWNYFIQMETLCERDTDSLRAIERVWKDVLADLGIERRAKKPVPAFDRSTVHSNTASSTSALAPQFLTECDRKILKILYELEYGNYLFNHTPDEWRMRWSKEGDLAKVCGVDDGNVPQGQEFEEQCADTLEGVPDYIARAVARLRGIGHRDFEVAIRKLETTALIQSPGYLDHYGRWWTADRHTIEVSKGDAPVDHVGPPFITVIKIDGAFVAVRRSLTHETGRSYQLTKDGIGLAVAKPHPLEHRPEAATQSAAIQTPPPIEGMTKAQDSTLASPSPTATTAPVLDSEAAAILRELGRCKSIVKTYVELDDATNISRKTVGIRVKELLNAGLVHRPKGAKGGVAITDKGTQFLANMAK